MSGQAAAALRGRRVLIVEDESLLALLLEEMLAEIGCEVVGSADTVAAATEMVEQLRPELTILDVKLGEERSYAVAELLTSRNLPFVFTTGYGDDEVGNNWHGHRILLKPFAQDQLTEALAGAIGATAIKS